MGTIPKKNHGESPEEAVRRLTDRVNELEAELKEANAKVWLLEQDAAVLGPENARLFNALNAARTEIQYLKLPKAAGRPEIERGYSYYLWRETRNLLAQSTDVRTGKCSMTEQDACVEVDRRIRETAHNLNVVGWAAEFGHLPRQQPKVSTITRAWREAKKKYDPPKVG